MKKAGFRGVEVDLFGGDGIICVGDYFFLAVAARNS